MAEKKPDFTREVARKAHRKAEARRTKKGDVWFWLGMFGLVGWSVAIPTVIAIAIGLWLDRTWPGPPSWTLNLLIIGMVVGCLNAWYWIKQESRRE
jgi:ATP synthase protein I